MKNSLGGQLESILFVAAKPLRFRALSKLLEVDQKSIEETLFNLEKEYKNANRGIQIVFSEDEVQFVSSEANATIVKKFLKEEVSGELTRPSIETLTIIAYRGPITKTEIEKIRGVNSSLILRNLLLRGLIAESTEGDVEPRFWVTIEFLKYLGVGSVKELPDYNTLSIIELLK